MGLIYDNVLGAGAASVASGTLPTNYRHLLVIGAWRTNSATAGGVGVGDPVGIRLNGDSGTNYQFLAPDASTASGSSRMNVGVAVGGAAVPGDLFAANFILIPHYNGTANKKVLIGVAGGINNNSANYAGAAAISLGSWSTLAAITSLTFVCNPTPGTTQFVADSRFTIYGLN